MRCLIRSSRDCVVSSVGCGGGFMVVSKSRSTSRAEFIGLCDPETSPRMNHSRSPSASSSSC